MVVCSRPRSRGADCRSLRTRAALFLAASTLLLVVQRGYLVGGEAWLVLAQATQARSAIRARPYGE